MSNGDFRNSMFVTCGKHNPVAGWQLAAIVAVAGSFAGCALWEPAKVTDKPPREGSAWTDAKREKAPPGSQLGLDARARDIERSLGVE